MNACDQCGEQVFRTRFIRGKWLGLDCRCVRELPVDPGAVNPYADLTLDHVSDEYGNKVRITSSRQLGEAEKRYNFASVTRNFNSDRIEQAPQQKVFTVSDMYKRKFVRGG